MTRWEETWRDNLSNSVYTTGLPRRLSGKWAIGTGRVILCAALWTATATWRHAGDWWSSREASISGTDTRSQSLCSAALRRELYTTDQMWHHAATVVVQMWFHRRYDVSPVGQKRSLPTMYSSLTALTVIMRKRGNLCHANSNYSVLLSWRKVLVLVNHRKPFHKFSSLSLSIV